MHLLAGPFKGLSLRRGFSWGDWPSKWTSSKWTQRKKLLAKVLKANPHNIEIYPIFFPFDAQICKEMWHLESGLLPLQPKDHPGHRASLWALIFDVSQQAIWLNYWRAVFTNHFTIHKSINFQWKGQLSWCGSKPWCHSYWNLSPQDKIVPPTPTPLGVLNSDPVRSILTCAPHENSSDVWAQQLGIPSGYD